MDLNNRRTGKDATKPRARGSWDTVSIYGDLLKQFAGGLRLVSVLSRRNVTDWQLRETTSYQRIMAHVSMFIKPYFFVALFVLSLCSFDISVGVGAFVIGLSQNSSFFPC